MKTTYETNGWWKMAEEDDYANGCKPGTGSCSSGNDRFTGASLKELIEKLNAFCWNDDPENVLLDSCDEPGRVDIQVLENESGCRASKGEVALWKEGNKRLWLSCYSFRIELVTRESVSLVESGVTA